MYGKVTRFYAESCIEDKNKLCSVVQSCNAANILLVQGNNILLIVSLEGKSEINVVARYNHKEEKERSTQECLTAKLIIKQSVWELHPKGY